MSKMDELRQAQAKKKLPEQLRTALADRIGLRFADFLGAKSGQVKIRAVASSEGGGTTYALGVIPEGGDMAALNLTIHDAGSNFVIEFPGKGLDRSKWPTVRRDHQEEDVEALLQPMFEYLKEGE